MPEKIELSHSNDCSYDLEFNSSIKLQFAFTDCGRSVKSRGTMTGVLQNAGLVYKEVSIEIGGQIIDKDCRELDVYYSTISYYLILPYLIFLDQINI